MYLPPVENDSHKLNFWMYWLPEDGNGRLLKLLDFPLTEHVSGQCPVGPMVKLSCNVLPVNNLANRTSIGQSFRFISSDWNSQNEIINNPGGSNGTLWSDIWLNKPWRFQQLFEIVDGRELSFRKKKHYFVESCRHGCCTTNSPTLTSAFVSTGREQHSSFQDTPSWKPSIFLRHPLKNKGHRMFVSPNQRTIYESTSGWQSFVTHHRSS